MQLRIYNTLTRQKEDFAPNEPGKASVYVCGITPYDYSHCGHARVYVVFDVVCRALVRLGYDVKYVRNFTDVEDKIIRRAQENGEAFDALAERFIAAYHDDMNRLGCNRPDVEPRVTTHMPEIMSMIEDIIARGHAYVVDGDPGSEIRSDSEKLQGRDVYFHVDSFSEYGLLSRRLHEDNADGASERVLHDARKKDQRDFALWKAAKPGEPAWPSPWGQGRPGWHIECSAMACKHLGTTFDLHGGGKDLVFPHHENEIAQARAANGGAFSKGWMHVGFLTLDAEKMSKSTGNFFTIRDVLARFHPQVLRYFLLTAHYLHPLNFSDKAMDEANRRVLYVYEKLAAADALLAGRDVKAGLEPAQVTQARADLLDALCDDFHTPRALAGLSEIVQALGTAVEKPKVAGNVELAWHLRAFFREAAGLLGVFDQDATAMVEVIVESARDRLFPAGSERLAWVETSIAQREAARAAKEWRQADELRDALMGGGVELRDGREGTTWRPQLAMIP